MDPERAAVGIFDLVDAHRIGQAEGALETALAKYPQHDSIRAAQALVLLRTDHVEKSRELALELSRKDITEAKAVNALVHVLQQCCCWEALAATYERLRPLQNERQISENLVQTYVRMGSYPKAQQVATQLYRTYAEPKYQVWMVQACLGQVPADSKDHLMLKLATKLLDASVLTEKGLMTPATVRTYVDVLIQQELFAEAVNFLCSARGAKIGLLETRLEVLSRVLAKQGRRALANAAARQLWRMHPDNWTPFELYRDTITLLEGGDENAKRKGTADATATLTLEASKPELRAIVSAAESDSTLEAAVELSRELQEAERASKRPQRGPFLAELTLLDKMGRATELQAAILSYVKGFYRKPCCYLDVSTFLTTESSAQVYAWSTEAAPAEEGDPKLGGGRSSATTMIAEHTRCILGLRCLVASWGFTRETVPDPESMRELMAKCQRLYEGAKSLSTSLEWNEEGHCDPYISVALNIALRGYKAFGEDLSWAVAGLELMQHVDRRMNNSAWLIFAVCFASRLGLVDTAAHRQLAFKSVQHDTMTHLGYWPLVRGLASDDIATWENLSQDYFRRVERDCSLLRAKVFTFTSWPAMRDVRRFQDRQAHSLARWLTVPNACAAALAACQTKKNIVELLHARGPELWQAWEALGSPKAVEELVDNSDWTVARSVVLGNIHSDAVKKLTEALVQVPTAECQLRRGRRLLASLLMLADVAALEQHRQGRANAPKPRKGKKNSSGNCTTGTEEVAGAEAAGGHLASYTARLAEDSWGPVECLPSVIPLAIALAPSLASGGEAAVTAVAGATATDALTASLQSITDSPIAESFEAFLYPEAQVLSALVRVLPVSAAPVAAWAAAIHSALLAAQERYDSGAWAFISGTSQATAAATSEDAFTGVLVREKARRVKALIADLIADVAASSRRK